MPGARHRWTECDDVVAVYLYKYGTAHLNTTAEQIAQRLGMTVASMTMRIQNVRSADCGIGLPNFAKQTQSVLDRFGGLPEAGLRAKVNAYLNSAKRQ